MSNEKEVREALDWADDPYTRCDNESNLKVLAAEVRRLQDAYARAREHERELYAEIAALQAHQPVSTAQHRTKRCDGTGKNLCGVAAYLPDCACHCGLAPAPTVDAGNRD